MKNVLPLNSCWTSPLLLNRLPDPWAGTVLRSLRKSATISLSKNPAALDIPSMIVPTAPTVLFQAYVPILTVIPKDVPTVPAVIYTVPIIPNNSVLLSPNRLMSVMAVPNGRGVPWKNICILLPSLRWNTSRPVPNPDLASVFRKRKLYNWIALFLLF